MKLLRQETALNRLIEQLDSGVKPVKHKPGETTKLQEIDIKRISKEIKILKKKTNFKEVKLETK
jgi:hypothetical protein